jgi:CHAT domain-containing protein/tetratricopeptide (TPR) repeat protein
MTMGQWNVRWLSLAALVVLCLCAPTHSQQRPNELAAINKRFIELRQAGKYAEAIPLAMRALELTRASRGENHADTATSMVWLADLYRDQGRYAEAEPLYRRSLTIREKALGPEHPDVAMSLSDLAGLYGVQGRSGEVEPLYRRAVAIYEKAGPSKQQALAITLDNLGECYLAQRRYAEAEQLKKRSLALREKVLGPEHPSVATGLHNLAALYAQQGRYAEAEPLDRRSLAIREKALGPEHPDVAYSLNSLAWLYGEQGRYTEAEPLQRRALAIREKALGVEHPDVAGTLNNLAWLALVQNDIAGAASLWGRATAILQHRAERGLAESDGGVGKGEVQSSDYYFSGLVKMTHRLATPDPTERAKQSREMFETAQWAHASDAATSLSQMATRAAAGSAELADLVRERQDLVAEWQGKDQRLIAAASEPPARRKPAIEKSLSDRLLAIDARIATIDARLAKDFPNYAALAKPRPISVQDVQSQLREDEALVLVFVTDDRFRPVPEETFLWVVTKTEVRWVRSELGTAALRRHVAALRCGLDASAWRDKGEVRCRELLKVNFTVKEAETDKPLPFDVSRAHALYKGLFGEVEDLIRNKHLMIVPSGPLTQLPFQVLVTAIPRNVIAGEFEREVGRLGAELRPLSVGERNRLPGGTMVGVGVAKPIPGGPGAVAGLRAGDILLAVDESGFATVSEAVATIQAAGLGRTVTLKLVRDGQHIELPVTLGSLKVKDWKPWLLDAGTAAQTRWLIRDHPITILPAVSSLSALRRLSHPSAASRLLVGFANPLLEGPDLSYSSLAREARDRQICPDRTMPHSVALNSSRTDIGQVVLRGGVAEVAQLRSLSPLPETATELCTFAASLGAAPTDVRLGARATEREVKALSASGALAQARIVYFATHGALAGQVNANAEPGLVLTPPTTASAGDDGYLSASEIATLKLDADWVILSACNTAAAGAQSAEALSGLARAFFYAGARALLVSHWEVDSDATTVLAVSTAQALARDPSLGRAEALRRAMLAMINGNKAEYTHPSYWAPFVVVGEGGR